MTKKNWENLAAAIVIQAVKDYRKALTTVGRYRTGKKLEAAKSMVTSCEAFFKSDYAAQLTAVDLIAIMERIQREVAPAKKKARKHNGRR